jgi:hypothetical protein
VCVCVYILCAAMVTVCSVPPVMIGSENVAG